MNRYAGGYPQPLAVAAQATKTERAQRFIGANPGVPAGPPFLPTLPDFACDDDHGKTAIIVI